MSVLYRVRARLLACCVAAVAVVGAIGFAPTAGAANLVTGSTYLAVGDSLTYGYHAKQFCGRNCQKRLRGSDKLRRRLRQRLRQHAESPAAQTSDREPRVPGGDHGHGRQRSGRAVHRVLLRRRADRQPVPVRVPAQTVHAQHAAGRSRSDPQSKPQRQPDHGRPGSQRHSAVPQAHLRLPVDVHVHRTRTGPERAVESGGESQQHR